MNSHGNTSGNTFWWITAEHTSPAHNKKPALTRIYGGHVEVGRPPWQARYFPMQNLANRRNALLPLGLLVIDFRHGNKYGNTFLTSRTFHTTCSRSPADSSANLVASAISASASATVFGPLFTARTCSRISAHHLAGSRRFSSLTHRASINRSSGRSRKDEGPGGVVMSSSIHHRRIFNRPFC